MKLGELIHVLEHKAENHIARQRLEFAGTEHTYVPMVSHVISHQSVKADLFCCSNGIVLWCDISNENQPKDHDPQITERMIHIWMWCRTLIRL